MTKKKKWESAGDVIAQAKKIAFYGRVSTKEQEKEEESHQEGTVGNFLERYQKAITKPYKDTISAYSKSFRDREQFEELLSAIEKKEYDAIVVSDRDRLSRQTEEHFILRDLLNKMGVPVVIASRGELYDSNDFIRNLVEDALTKLESDNISARTKATFQSLLDREQYIGGKPPYGYKPVKKDGENGKVIGFTPEPEKISKVIEIFNMYKKSETFSSIARILNNNSKEMWSSSKVKTIVLNPIYTGYSVYNRYEISGKSRKLRPINEWKWFPCSFIKKGEEIISREDWWYCWFKYNETKEKAPRYLSTSYYLNDILQCHCGSEMKGKDQRTNIKHGKQYGNRYYVCKNKNCKEKIVVDEIHQLVMDIIFGIPQPKDMTENEIRRLLSSDISVREKEVSQYKELIRLEKDNLNVLQTYVDESDKKDRLLYDSDNHELLAYLLSKADSEQKINSYQEELEEKESILKRLNDLLVYDSLIKERVAQFFDKNSWIHNSNIENRNLVLLLVEECQLAKDKSINIKIKSLVPKEIKLFIK